MRVSVTAVAVTLVVFAASCSQPISPTGPSPGSGGSFFGVSRTTATSAPQNVPFTGTLEGVYDLTFTGPTTLSVSGEGTGRATHLGQFAFEYDEIVNLVTGTGAGTYRFTAANGDILTAAWSGVGLPTSDPNVLSVIEDATITGGTGRFDDASGNFRVERLFDFTTSAGPGSFAGTIELR